MLLVALDILYPHLEVLYSPLEVLYPPLGALEVLYPPGTSQSVSDPLTVESVSSFGIIFYPYS